MKTISLIALLFLSSMSFVCLGAEKKRDEPSDFTKVNQEIEHSEKTPIKVSVLGRVANPGSHMLKASDNVWAALDAADADKFAHKFTVKRIGKDGLPAIYVHTGPASRGQGVPLLLCDGDAIFIPETPI